MSRSYLDHAATSPMSSEVLATYASALTTVGNAASTHTDGQRASQMLEDARERIALALDCEPVEVIFTSGGTESINLALKGSFWERQRGTTPRPIILVPEGEHHATVDAVNWLSNFQGAQVVWLPIDELGVLQPETLRQAIAEYGHENIAVVSFLWANNEVGSVAPVAELCALAHVHGIPVHVDAVAALGQLPVSVRDSGAAMVSVSAHKVGGPVGVGALVLRRSAQIQPLIHGGSQQRSRSGTQDIAGAVAFAEALRLVEPISEHQNRLASLRDYLIREVMRVIPDARLQGAAVDDTEARLPGNAHFVFPGCQGDSLLYLLDAAGVSVSVGSACQAGVQEVSHVLLAMGLPEELAIGALRMTLGRGTTRADVDAFIEALPAAVDGARKAGFA